jgi:ribosome-associated protein
LSKKADNPIILDVRGLSDLCEYFVICSGETGIQVRAIYEEVIKCSKENNFIIHHSEDDIESRWILVDFFDVILHIFIDEARKYYNLEYLWRNAKQIKIPKKKVKKK